MITHKEWKHYLKTLGYPQPDRAPRRQPVGLAAMYGSISSPSLGHVSVISTTGLFLLTTERWPIGEVVSLTLQKENLSAGDPEMQIDVQARVASHGEDGVGLAFILPQELDPSLWEHVIENTDALTVTEKTQSIFRMVRAVLFLYRLCGSRAKEPISVLTGELDELRTKSMLAIALMAEAVLVADPDADKMHAHPQTVATILEEGSWENDSLKQRLWAGLLVSSCNLEGTTELKKDLIELITQLTPNQVHIFVEACRRASDQTPGPDGKLAEPVIVSPEDMVRATGTHDLYRSAADVAYLHSYSLVENSFDSATYAPKNSFEVTPTPFGMQVYDACKGHLIEKISISSHA